MIGFSAEKIRNKQERLGGNVKRDIRRLKEKIRSTARFSPADDYIRVSSHSIEYANKEQWKDYFLQRGFSVVDTTDRFGFEETRIYWK